MSEIKEKHIVLIADDNPSNLKVLNDALIESGYEVRVALNGTLAIKSIEIEPPNIVLLDVHMPEMDGYEVCKYLKKNIQTKDIPVIFISALNEQFNKVKAFGLGAVDYITKPIEIEIVIARIKVHLNLCRKVQELREFNKVMVDREMRIIELKKEVNSLAKELGRPDTYPEIWEEESQGD